MKKFRFMLFDLNAEARITGTVKGKTKIAANERLHRLRMILVNRRDMQLSMWYILSPL